MNVLRAWCVNGMFQMTKSRTVLTIPLPVKLIPLRMYVENGELVVVLRNPIDGENDGRVCGRRRSRYVSRRSACDIRAGEPDFHILSSGKR